MFKYPKVLAAAIILGLVVVSVSWLKDKRLAESSSDVPGWSWIIGGKVIVIDAGHGGVDPGAVGVNKTLEKDINLEIAKRLKPLFDQAGCKVIMLREDDRDFGTSSKLLQRKREDLAYRIQKAAESYADIYLSIHANSFGDQRQQGPQVFYHPESAEGKSLAQSIQTSLNKLSAKKREAKPNQTYFILKNTDMVSVTIEVGFLSNPGEERKLNEAEYQEKIAMAVFEGVGNYLAAEKTIVADD
jgi:N-acetylmuramoyl-L-alanine amidase